MNRVTRRLAVPALLILLCAQLLGGAQTPPAPAASSRTLADDLAFLRRHGDVEVLRTPGGAQVVLSARYQGRVMTSAVAAGGTSLGWVNHEFIASGRTGTPFDNYGGEDRFWLGPEAGQFGLYFPRGAPFELSSWQVPAALQEGAWTIRDQSATGVTYTRALRVTNYSGTMFAMQVERTVRLLAAGEAAAHLGLPLPADVRWVGFETVNRVTNAGDVPWAKERGLPSIWILGMFNAVGSTRVMVPIKGTGGEEAVNDRYFGKVPADRLSIRDGVVVFSADGRYRSKIGIGPAHATQVMGSYSPEAQLLTLVQFAPLPEGAAYVNSMWEQQKDPYAGDVVNSYNDGPPNKGGWYELESSSPALELAPGRSATHTHRTLHIVGRPEHLDSIATRVLGHPVGR